MVSKLQAVKNVQNWNRIGKEITYKYRELDNSYTAGTIEDYVWALEGSEKEPDYKQMIEKVKEKDQNSFRISYATVFHIKRRNKRKLSKKELKTSYYANQGSQMAATPNEYTFYNLLLQAFRRKGFLSKAFKRQIYSILEQEFKK